MAGEIQVNSVTALTESDSNIILNNVDTATNRTNLGLGSMSTQNANAVAITGGSVSGASIVPDSPFSFRNKIINGNLKSDKVIKQRGISTITGATGYTFDRWYYDGSTYLYQGIEDANVENGTYAISWVGSGINAAWKVSTDSSENNGPDATTGFTSVSNGGTFTVNEVTEFSKHLWIRFDGTLSNLDKVQVERDAVTPFEYRPRSIEIQLCQRYYQKSYNIDVAPGSNSAPGRYYAFIAPVSTSGNKGSMVNFKVSMRVAPTVTVYKESDGTTGVFNNGSTANVIVEGHGSFLWYANSASSDIYAHWTANSEL